MPPIAQGRNGYAKIGSVFVPCYSWQLSAPRNLQAPQPVGSSWSTNFGEGLQTARFVANVMLRNKANEFLGASAGVTGLLGAFTTRTFSGGFDDTGTVTLEVSNGKRIYTLANAKPEAFVITGAKGAPIGLQVVYVAPALPTMADRTATTYDRQIDASAPLMYNALSFTGLSGSVYGFEVSYANNHLPNAPLDGTRSASSWDAGSPTAGARFTFDARAVASEPFADLAGIGIQLACTGFNRVLTLGAVTPNNPLDADGSVAQAFVSYQCLVQGTGTNPPLVVS